jgi:hypothetical protein
MQDIFFVTESVLDGIRDLRLERPDGPIAPSCPIRNGKRSPQSP